MRAEGQMLLHPSGLALPVSGDFAFESPNYSYCDLHLWDVSHVLTAAASVYLNVHQMEGLGMELGAQG